VAGSWSSAGAPSPTHRVAPPFFARRVTLHPDPPRPHPLSLHLGFKGRRSPPSPPSFRTSFSRSNHAQGSPPPPSNMCLSSAARVASSSMDFEPLPSSSLPLGELPLPMRSAANRPADPHLHLLLHLQDASELAIRHWSTAVVAKCHRPEALLHLTDDRAPR
jgi:hypothetical protein